MNLPTVFPAIKNWQMSPPAGGWSLTVEVNGFQRFLQGRDPHQVLAQAQTFATQVSYEPEPGEIEALLNAIWAERDPNRALPTAPPLKPQSQRSRKVSKLSYFGPTEYGSKVWGWLACFGMPGAFDKDQWMAAIQRTSKLLNPTISSGTGCAQCFEEWMNILQQMKPEEVTNELLAAKFVFNAHNRVNEKLNKRLMRWDNACHVNGWSQ